MGAQTATKVLLVAGFSTLALGGGCARSEPEAERTAIVLQAASVPASREASAPSRRPTVVMLVLDEFPVDHLLGPDGRIDAGRYPGFAALAATGTWFPNAHTVYDSTSKSVPAILDARLPEPGSVATFEDHPRSVYDLFAGRGYRIVRSEEASSICPPRHCPKARQEPPPVQDLLHSGRPARLHRFIESIKPGRPAFYMKHVLLPHGPHVYLPSGKRARRQRGEQLPGLETVPGFGDRSATRYNQQRLMLQMGYVDLQVRSLVRRMKRLRMFGDSLLVITADHGMSSEIGVPSRRRTTPANIDELAPVPLFIKAPGQRRGQIDMAYVRTIDVVPTMADILGFRMPYRADGHSAFSPTVQRRRTVKVIARDFSGTIAIGARSLQRRRRALLRTRLRRFGSGDWTSLHTGAAPYRRLLGLSLTELGGAKEGRTDARAELIGATDFTQVAPASGVVPTQVTGRVTRASRAPRDIAVAVNGRVEALGRTFRLGGLRRELFAVNVPESSMRPGRNEVAVFEVAEGGRTLRPLGGIRPATPRLRGP